MSARTGSGEEAGRAMGRASELGGRARRGAQLVLAWLALSAGAAQGQAIADDVRSIEQLSTLGAAAAPLALQDAIERTLERNLGLRSRVKQLEASTQRVKGSWGVFVPVLNVGGGVQPKRFENLTQVLNSFDAWQRGTQVGGNWNLGFEGRLFTGTSYSIDWRQTSVRIDNGELEYVDEVPPGLPDSFEYSFQQAGLTLGLNQNLLQGLSPAYNLRALNQAKITERLAVLDRDEQVANVVADVLKGYLDLVAARRNVEIAVVSQRLAEDQREVTEARIAVGELAPIELLRIDETVASRAVDRLEAERAAEEAQQQIELLMGLSPDDPEFGQPLRPVDGIPDVLPARDRERSLQVSLERNFALAKARAQLEGNDVQLKAARHEMLPTLDLNASLLLNGTGPDQGEAVTDVFTSQYPDLTVGVRFSMPLPDIGAIHELKGSELDLEAALLSLKGSEQEVLARVASAFRSVQSFEKQTEAARARTRLAERTAEAQEATYQVGRSTLRDVLDAQRSLEEARQAEVAAEVQVLKARIDLELARGTLLDALSVEYE